jgi:o-succinylbenzoate---CoA ligase
MDATLLIDPAFWTAPETIAADGRDVSVPGLTNHVLFETSGSTGSAKQIALSKQALLISAAAVNSHLQVSENSVWALALPLHHVGGFGVVARAFEAACDLKTYRGRWDPSGFREWLSLSGATHLSLVPAQVHDLVKAGLTAPASLVAIVVGGGALDGAAGQAARDLGWPVLASFGMTEAASQIATHGLAQLGAPYQSGAIPLLPIWQARVSQDDRLELSGPALFSGFVIDGRFIPRADEWHTTSDRVAVDDGRITPLGRADVMVKILGELVDPEAIERELTKLSGRRLAPGSFAVIAIPDERAGHSLVPVFEATVDGSLIEECLRIYNKQAPGFRRLGPAAILAELPRGGLGKIRRADIAAAYHRFMRS